MRIQNNFVAAVLSGGTTPPAFIRLVNAVPWLQGRVAALIGLGIRREHVHTPAAPAQRRPA